MGIMLLVGVVILVQSILEIVPALRSRSWPTAEAEVTGSSIAYLVGGKSHYEPTVSYTYRVGGRSYTNDQIWFGPSHFFFRSSALDVITPYPVGARLRVSYSPEDPYLSVIRPGVRWESAAKIVLAVGIIILAAWFIGHRKKG